jgi:hypothetical protein
LVGLLLGAAVVSRGYLSSSRRVFHREQSQAIAAKAGFGDTVLIIPRSDKLSLLRSLSYVQSSFDANAEQDGVLVHEQGKAFAGYTFWSSRFRNSAALIEMDGNTIHEWHRPLGPEGWHRAELLRSGEIVVVVENQSITKLTLDSEIVWQFPTRAHHSLSVTEDGMIYALSKDVKERPEINAGINSVSDKILILDPDGTLKTELSIIDARANIWRMTRLAAS